MAKPKSTPSTVMLAAEAAREAVKPLKEALTAAKEKLAKADTAPNKAGVEKAEAALNAASAKLTAAVKAENRERFENVGGGRVANILKGLKNLKGVANRRTYEFDADDITIMFNAINADLNAARKAFDVALAATVEKKAGAVKEKFSFKAS